MSELTDSLDRFNRKERNLLIRDALGPLSSGAPSLTDAFLKRIGAALGGLDIPEDAWWTTDFHLNWIAGALALWRYGEKAVFAAQANNLPENARRRLVEQSQEDVDFLIVYDTTLI